MLIQGQELTVAWLGDSQAMLVRKGEAVTLMDPHKPEREVRIHLSLTPTHTSTHTRNHTKDILRKALRRMSAWVRTFSVVCLSNVNNAAGPLQHRYLWSVQVKGGGADKAGSYALISCEERVLLFTAHRHRWPISPKNLESPFLSNLTSL